MTIGVHRGAPQGSIWEPLLFLIKEYLRYTQIKILLQENSIYFKEELCDIAFPKIYSC